jgi:hypothetical protein
VLGASPNAGIDARAGLSAATTGTCMASRRRILDCGRSPRLDRDVQAFEEDVAIFRFYPVLSVGVSLGRP